MKFRIGALLSFLSGIAFFSAPAVSMKNEEVERGEKIPSLKVKTHITRGKSSLKEFLGKQDYPDAFIKIKAGLSPTVPDEEIVNFLMTSNRYLGWDTVDPHTKGWVVSKITKEAKRKDLENFLSKQDYSGAFRSTKANTTASDEEIVNFLMTSNKYPGWDTVDLNTKRWVVAEVTGKPYHEIKALVKVASTITDDIEAAKRGNPSSILERVKQTDKQIAAYITIGDKRLAEAYSAQKRKLEAILERLNPKHPSHFSLKILAKGLVKGQETIADLEKGPGAPVKTVFEGEREEKKADPLLARIQQYERTVPEYFRLSLVPTIKLAQDGGDGRPVRVILKAIFNDNGQGEAWDNLGEEGQAYLVAQISGKPIVKSLAAKKEVGTKTAITVKPKLPPIPSKDFRPGRERFNYQGKNFSEYNVYMAGNNCGLNALDVHRKDAISSLEEYRKELSGDLPLYLNESKTEGANFDHMLLPYVGRFLLGANINVLQKPEEGKILVPTMMAFLPEYLPPDPKLPTLNLLWEGQHYRILVPEGKSEEVDLLREYAKTKEYLAFTAEDLVQRDESDRAYAEATNMQFLNDRKGGWLKSYVDWLKARK
ncbi:MAG: hypothetical protein JSR85_06770 [Proteobacteria bacterium]|nr:hypothetical protein [Pseudomonadota bacterium]